MTDTAEQLQLIEEAINNNNTEEARQLLRPLMEENVVEAFYYASRVAYTQEQSLEFLEYALQLEPNNTLVRERLKQLQQLYDNQSALIIAEPPAYQAQTRIQEKITTAVDLFKSYGWQVVLQEDDHAQLKRRQTMSAFNAFILGLMLHLFGFVLVIILIISANIMHVFIEADEDDLLLTTSKGDTLLTRPEQSIIFLDKTRGINLWQGLLWAGLGVIIATIMLLLLKWQVDTAFQNLNDALILPTSTPFPDL